MVPLNAVVMFWNLYGRGKSFSTEKKIPKFFLFQQSLDPNTNFFSHSDPVKAYGFFRIRIRIRTHNTGKYLRHAS
jgi:hypothetical protein